MARQFQSGFEFNSTGLNFEWAANTASPTIVTTAPRSGTYHLRVVTLGSGTIKGMRVNVTSAGTTSAVLFGRAYVRVITLPGANGSSVIAFAARNGFTTPICYARLTSTGTLELWDNVGQIGTTSLALSADGNYHRIELKYDASAAAGSHIVELKVTKSDGSTETVTASNRDVSAVSGASFTVGGNLAAEANTTGEWYIDDCACNDNSGTDQATYPGAGKIVMLFANGDGDTTNRGSQGTDWETQPTPGGLAYQQVDEVGTPDDATSYLQLLTTSAGTSDPPVMLFTVEAASSKGVASNHTIKVVAARARQGSPGDATGRNGVILVKSGSTFSESAVLAYSGSTWSWDDPAGFNPWSKRVNYVDPNTSAAWTLAALEAAQVGARAHNDVTPPPCFSSFALDVEFDDTVIASVRPQRFTLLGVG